MRQKITRVHKTNPRFGRWLLCAILKHPRTARVLRHSEWEWPTLFMLPKTDINNQPQHSFSLSRGSWLKTLGSLYQLIEVELASEKKLALLLCIWSDWDTQRRSNLTEVTLDVHLLALLPPPRLGFISQNALSLWCFSERFWGAWPPEGGCRELCLGALTSCLHRLSTSIYVIGHYTLWNHIGSNSISMQQKSPFQQHGLSCTMNIALTGKSWFTESPHSHRKLSLL